MSHPPVLITFECLPLRTIGRLDYPLDASPAYRSRCDKLKQAIETHGSFNTYYLLNAQCVYHLTNDPTVGVLTFAFEGTVLTDPTDTTTKAVDLEVALQSQSCDWLTLPATEWFYETVRRAVAVEFNRYIAAGDLHRAIARVEEIQRQSEAHGGYLGMGL